MTLKQMVQVLIDKGHRRDWAEAQARADIFELNLPAYKKIGDDENREDCSVCRRTFTVLEMRYHFHPCE